ncbi:metallophosphoesterase [Bryobacter aggregatus]|uniref:metallophosphoesterase n=1 Tax=Bryobacter aggregatus TaxID=360054 RepID=UPI0004E24E64|nr:metallophosphoesterase [Bryobacter aggregatus]
MLIQNRIRCFALQVTLLASLGISPLAFGVTLVRSPYLQNVQQDHASILWTTREPGVATVSFTDGRSVQTVRAKSREFSPEETGMPDVFYQHEADLTALQPGVNYQYMVLVNDVPLSPSLSNNQALHFMTAGPGRFSFLVLGDSGSGSPEQLQLAGRLNAEQGISLVIHTGDLAYENGTFAQFDDRYFAPYRALMGRLPFFPTPGNHEYYTQRAAPYLAVNAFPDNGGPAEDRGRYYSFDWGDAHFVSLDSNLLRMDASERMLQWLEEDLKGTGKFWKIVFFHHTPYPSGYHLDDPICAAAKEKVVPILDRYGVQLVLNGHEHSYQRTVSLVNSQPVSNGGGTVYINSSGGGAWLQPIGEVSETAVSLHLHNYLRVDLDGVGLTVRALGITGTELDKVVLAPVPVIQSVANGGDFSTKVAGGSWIAIFGQNLAQSAGIAAGLPETTLNGTSVRLGGRSLPLSYVSPQQINAHLPFDALGPELLTVHTANGSSTKELDVVAVAPAIFAVLQGAQLVTANQPATAGETILVLGTGLGAVAGELAPGAPAPSPAVAVLYPVLVHVDGQVLTPTFAGLFPGIVGLYEVIVPLPKTISLGQTLLQLEVDGAKSNPVLISIVAGN